MRLLLAIRVLASLTLVVLLLATPVYTNKPPTPPVVHTSPEAVVVASEDDRREEKGRLVEHLRKAWRVPVDLAERIVRSAYREAHRIGESPALLLGMMAKESSFRPDASSHFGAVGLMQVVPRYHRDKVADDESFEHPETNIRVGADVLRAYLDEANGRLDVALKKYSGSARQYFQRVKAYQQEFEQAKEQDA